MDDTYRTQLRDLNELNWNRFQAAMDARFAEFEVKMEHGFAALKAAVDAKMDQRFRAVDARFTAMDDRFAASDLKMEQRFAASDLKMEQRFAAMHVTMERRYGDHTKSLIGLWLATVIPLGGLIVGLFNSIR